MNSILVDMVGLEAMAGLYLKIDTVCRELYKELDSYPDICRELTP
jgi:hypothetical protein